MNLTELNFNAQQEEEWKGTFDPLPEGDYRAIIEASEEKTTNAGDGSYLALTFQIIDGPHKGKRVWTNLNLKNPSADAVRIARAELAAICKAVNVPAPKDSSDLHELPMTIHVKLKKRSDNGEMKNVISAYHPKDKAQQAATATAAAAGSKAPWKKS